MRRLIAKSERANLDELIAECSDFNNWLKPDNDNLQREYNVEYKYHTINQYGDIWPTFDDFLEAANNGNIITLSEQDDYQISNRSRTTSMDELISLVSSYRSWPQYRNMDTLQGIIEGFLENSPMTMPIVIEHEGHRQIFSGNTRLDIAFMMHVTPQVLVIKF